MKISIVSVISLLILVPNVALMLLSFPVGIYTVFFTHLSSISYTQQISGIYIFAGPQAIVIPVSTTIGTIFLVPLLIYLSLFILSFFKRMSIFDSVKKSLREGASYLLENDIFSVILFTGLLVFTSSVIDYIQSLFGVQTGSLIQTDALSAFVGLTIASLREEFGFRMLIIGVTSFVITLPDVKKSLMSVWKPGTATSDATRKTIVIASIVVSSFAFGLAHYTSGSGWQIGKVTEATFAGLILGYTYMKYGFHFPVLIHWCVDYFGSVFSFYGQGAYNVPWDSQNMFWLSSFINTDLLVIVGILGTFLIIYYSIKNMIERNKNISSLNQGIDHGSAWKVSPGGAD